MIAFACPKCRATLKAPEAVADRILSLLTSGFETGHRERID